MVYNTCCFSFLLPRGAAHFGCQQMFTMERKDLDEGYKDKRVPEECNLSLRFLALTPAEQVGLTRPDKG